MSTKYSLPPNPQNVVLKRIYPWEEYNLTMILQWLYTQAQKTGFPGTFEDFKQRYGVYVEASDPQDIQDLINEYTGTYHIIPLVGIEQVLQTKNTVLNQNIVVDPIPDELLDTHKKYSGRYSIIPSALTQQVLHTANRVVEENIIIEKIPFTKTENAAGGYTFSIG